MKNSIAAILLFTLGQLLAAPVEFSNSEIKVIYDQQKLSFYARNSATPFMKEVLLSDLAEQKSEVRNANHPIFGTGSQLVITEESGSHFTVSLYETLPFVMIQKTIKNATQAEQKIAKLPLIEGQASLGVGASALKTMSTAGLKEATTPTGSYMFLAVANPKNNEGVVCAWLTTERGSGIVFSESSNNQVILKARIDYGDLRLSAGKTAESEILLVGYGADVRTQLEAYADAIALNMKIKLPPQPTIYCTWYHGGASDEKKIAANTDFASEHLKPYGLKVMQIDDRWQLGKEGNGPKRNFSGADPKGPYPSGMKATADYIKTKGMTPGIWYIPFAGSYYDDYWKDKMDLFLIAGEASDNFFGKSRNGRYKVVTDLVFEKGKVPYDTFWGGTCLDLTNPRTQEYIAFIAKRLSKEWGYKYFKLDGLWTGSGTRTQYVNSFYKDDDLGTQIRFNTAITPIEGYVKGFQTIREAAGEDVFLLGCAAPQNMRSFGAGMGRVDAMRIGPDNGASLAGLLAGPKYTSRVYFLNKRVWYNDPDPGYPRVKFPLNNAQCSMSWLSLTGSLHGSSEQYADLPADRLKLLRQSMPSHDLKTVRPVDYLDNDIPTVWHLTDKRDAVQKDVIGLFNFDMDKGQNISCALDRMDLPKADRYVGFDFWTDKFIPPFSGSISGYLPMGSCRIISIRPEQNFPQVVSTSRHLTQGVVELTNEKWNATSHVLSGTSELIAGDDYEIRLVVPSSDNGWLMDSMTTSDPTAKTSFVQEGNAIRAQFKSSKNQKVDWSIQFKKGDVRPLETPKVVIDATVDLDQVIVKWNNMTPYQYRLSRNGEIMGEFSAESHIDRDVKLGVTYKYGVQTKSWDGKWSKAAETTIIMPASYPKPPVPPLPDVYCTDLNASGKIKKNQSYSGDPILLDGKVQANGIGALFSQEVNYRIPKNSKRFVTSVAMEKTNPRDRCVFAIYGDVLEMGEQPVELARSPELNAGEVWHFNVELDPRYKLVKLLSRPARPCSTTANVNWINPGFVK